jgi:hypothetical protein
VIVPVTGPATFLAVVVDAPAGAAVEVVLESSEPQAARIPGIAASAAIPPARRSSRRRVSISSSLRFSSV